MMLRTRLTLMPGANGTKSLVERYGERLVCVRYRYREPIYQQARVVARRLIEQERSGDVRLTASISAEAKLVGQADERSGSLRQILEITHNFQNQRVA